MSIWVSDEPKDKMLSVVDDEDVNNQKLEELSVSVSYTLWNEASLLLLLQSIPSHPSRHADLRLISILTSDQDHLCL